MTNPNGVLYACTLDGNGNGHPLDEASMSEKVSSDELTWVHLDANSEAAQKWLRSEIPYLDSIIVDALLAEETRPRILEFEKGVLMILRGVNLNEDAQPEDMVSIRLWVDGSRIISVRRRRLKAVIDIQKRLENGTGPKNSGDFVTALTARLFERMEPVFTELDEKLDDLEEEVMEVPEAGERQKIIILRKQAIIFKRYIAPQKDVISYLRTSDQEWLDVMHKRRLQESLDRVIRYIEDLDAIRERAQIVNDELDKSLAEKLNTNMFVLSVLSAIFLPLGFLTGLLGINVGGIPGAEHPYAFMIFIGILCVIVAVQIWWFKKLKWF
ncbi:MAG: zinc transporter ZntB [Methyloligellaceae bacterium]